MIIRQFITPGLAIISYIVFDEVSRQGAIIDPTPQIEQYLRCAQQENITITYILETHVHADFVSGSQELKFALPNAKILSSSMGGNEWSPIYADQLVNDRDEIILGATRLQAWYTPGHTPEHIIWIAYDDQRNSNTPVLAFTGDLLFVGSVGRPDLLGKETQEILAKQLYNSLFHTLSELPDHLEIYPAHGAGSLCGKGIGARNSTTLGYERQTNIWLKPLPYEEWVKQLLKDMPTAPAYFKHMKQLNVTGRKAIGGNQELPPVLTLEQTLSLLKTCQIIDVRHPENFAAGHLKNAINVPLSPSFVTWAGTVIDLDKKTLIVVGNISEALFVVQSLKLIGMTDIAGVCNAGEQRSQEWNEIQHKSPMLKVDEVAENQDNYYVLDVRTPGEWHSGHIKVGHHVEMPVISTSIDQFPKQLPIAVFCHSGMRASVIASFLQSRGISASVVRGGMQEWIARALPTV